MWYVHTAAWSSKKATSSDPECSGAAKTAGENWASRTGDEELHAKRFLMCVISNFLSWHRCIECKLCTHGMHGCYVNQAQANKFGAVTFMWKWFGALSRHDTNEAHVTKTEILSSTESLLIIHCAICGKSHCLRKMFRISCGNLTNPVEEVVQRWRNAEAAGRWRTMMVQVNYCSFLWVTSLFKSKCRFSFTLMTQFSSQEERKRCVLTLECGSNVLPHQPFGLSREKELWRSFKPDVLWYF